MPTKRELTFLAEHFSGHALEHAALRVDNGEPLAYVIGEWYFYGLTFKLNKDCLVPRPDTEHVVDRAIELLPHGGSFADLGCGCGCIAVSILKTRPDTRALLCDLSHGAVEMARLNARAAGVESRADFVLGDMREKNSIPDGAAFDAIISNPPYIRSDVLPTLSAQVRSEPILALDGGADGLDFYRVILDLHLSHLKPRGHMIFEIGYDQANDVRRLCVEHALDCSVFRDYGGNDRVAVAHR